ncbi:MAG: aspartate aminotransferase family protein [Actinobacteria bacterium]|uniref:Pyridoxal-dependent decarboxylase n=1 Tax=Nostocoides veronense TaxID=330836 RepID=A0ABN2LPW6_9MICO|nr:aspartate aminotransferase family protein [Actinomycetota bacterium]
MSDFPYADRFHVHRSLPATGRNRAEVLAELDTMAREEDATWETGKISGTMYCGDHDHYAFLSEAFAKFAHVNALQRDLCPSQTKFEGEIIAMVLDLMHADAVTATTPAGLVTSGGTFSILHAILAYREYAAATRGISAAAGRLPNLVKPETAHPAFDKACHLFGIENRTVPVDPTSTLVDPATVAEAIDDNTIAIIGSAGNYPYGTIDPIAELGALALARGVGMHVDGCLGGFILPFGEELGYGIPAFDFRVPGVTSISADTHKYGYAFKGSSVVVFSDKAIRNAQYFHQLGWSGGKYMSPGMDGSRSGGMLASTWASMVTLGREGYRGYADAIFATARELMAAVRSHPDLRIMGEPTFCFSFTSDAFDIYHIADFMKPRGWRFNGQQYPNAIHLAVTRPQTKSGVVEAFSADLAEAVEYARAQQAAGRMTQSGAIYGGVVGGLSSEVESVMTMIMDGMLDTQQALPPRA